MTNLFGGVTVKGRLVFDASSPDCAPQKLLDISEITRLGWRAKTRLRDGIAPHMQIFLRTAATEVVVRFEKT
jgi:GDP-L-fucose synthase